MGEYFRKTHWVLSTLERSGPVFFYLGDFRVRGMSYIGRAAFAGRPRRWDRRGPECPMQRDPAKPREAERRSREPGELTEPKRSIDFTCVFIRFSFTKVWARISYSSGLQKCFPMSHFRIQFQNMKKLGLQCDGPPDHQVFNAFMVKNVNYLSKGPGRNYFGDNESWTRGAPALLHQSWQMIL